MALSTCIPEVWPIISMYSQQHLRRRAARVNPLVWGGLASGLVSAANWNSTVSRPFDYRQEVTLC